MKKWMVLLAALLIIFLAIVYLFIPSPINISAVNSIKATRDGTYRMLSSATEWKHWWNYNISSSNNRKDSIFTKGDFKYSLLGSGYNNTDIIIENSGEVVTSKLNILQLKTDSLVIIWQCNMAKTLNPFKKIQQYFFAVDLKENMDSVFNSFKAFAEKDENIYGLKIKQASVKDPYLITKKQMFNHKPTMHEVYDLIGDLKAYALANNCRQVDSPMLNILPDTNVYRVMVALPIDKEIKTTEPISFVLMTNGNFMVTKVKGGFGTVDNAMQQMQLYFDDYDRTSMAITFQYLITNRITETDTTKWITEIYAPVL